jgi:hypothetical protein
MRGSWLLGEELADVGKGGSRGRRWACGEPCCRWSRASVARRSDDRRGRSRSTSRSGGLWNSQEFFSIKSTCSVEVVNRDGNRKGRQRHGCLLAPIIRCRGGVLAAIERLIIAAYIGTAKGVAVGSVGSEGGIVAGSVVKFAVAFWMVTETAVGIACTIFRAGAEPFVVGPFDQWRSGGVSRGPSNIVGMLSTAGNKKTGNRDKQKSNTREFHRVLTICSRPTILGAFE